MQKHLAVLGAGASGISAAIEAKRIINQNNLNITVTVFEHLNKPLKKILATGNGRCNFCNTDLSFSHYYGDKIFIESILSSKYSDTTNFFKSMGVLHFIESTRIYPRSEQAASVRDALLKECERLKIDIITEFSGEITENSDGKFIISHNLFDALIVATGGKSGTSQGSDGSGFRLFEKYNHKIAPLTPALTGFIINEKNFKELKGLRVKGNFGIYSEKQLLKEEFGEIQFTETGISGIPVLNVSHFYNGNSNFFAVIDLCSEFSFKELRNHISNMKNFSPLLRTEELLSGIIPQKLAYYLMKNLNIKENTLLKMLTTEKINLICTKLKKIEFKISGVRDFKDSQVTSGGLKSEDFNEKTLMSEKKSGLFAAGEILNVNGECGGYNLHFAWTSGRNAGAAAVEFLKG